MDRDERRRQPGHPNPATSSAPEPTGATELATELIVKCSHCGRVYLEPEGWQRVEEPPEADQELRYTHGICPDCLRRHFPEFS